MDKMNHAAAVAKWKADQQVRIVRAQNSVREMENQVQSQKANIAEIILALYAKDALTEGQLIPLCQQISQIQSQIQSINQTIETTKQEQAPADPSLNSSAYQPTTNNTIGQTVDPSSSSSSGLVCPECGMALEGRFCPVHGKEGITPTP